jgi:Protein of unknown function (DUF4231)
MSEKKDKYILHIQKEAATKKKIWRTKDIFNSFLQFIIVGGAASVPVLLIIPQVPKIIPTIISGVVAVAAAIGNYYKFGEHSHIHRATYEALIKELNNYDNQVLAYNNLEEDQAFGLFVERTELVLDEHTKKIFSLSESRYQQIEIKSN